MQCFSDLDGEAEGEGEGEMDEIIIVDNTEDVLVGEYPADCFPETCYKRFPFLAGDDDAPFWQGWANLRLKTYQLIENKYFETAVITMILLSSMALVSISLAVAPSVFSFGLFVRTRSKLTFSFIGPRGCAPAK